MQLRKLLKWILLLLFAAFLPSCGSDGNSGSNTVSTLMGGAIQGRPLSLTTTVTTPVGQTLSTDGIGAAAGFNWPYDVTTDGANLYVADAGNNTIRKIVIATAEVSTLAGSADTQGSSDGVGAGASFYWPEGIVTDGINLYVTDSQNNTIRKIVIATGKVTTLAGTPGIQGSSDGIGAAASFNWPLGITCDGTNLYVVDGRNYTIRKIVIATGKVTTLAGTPRQQGTTDGVGNAARFQWPEYLTIVGTDLYVADSGIRKIDIASGTVTTMAGTASSFDWASGITSDGTNLYVMGSSVGGLISKVVIATGNVTTLAASSGPASFYWPNGITTDGSNLYVADSGNCEIKKIVISTGDITTLAGSTDTSGSSDGTGSAASFHGPHDITTDGTNLYVADSYNNTIRKIIIATNVVTTLAGSAGIQGSADGTGAAASFWEPNGITTDGANLYVVDTKNNTIRKIVIASGEVTTLAGTAGISGSADGIGAAASFKGPNGITTDGTNLFVTDTDNNTIRKIVIGTGVVTTIAGTAGTFGSVNGIGAAASFDTPTGITTDGHNLYVTDYGTLGIRKIGIASGAVTTLTNITAGFSRPYGVTTDGTSLFVTDTMRCIVAKVVIASGTVTNLAGGPYGYNKDGVGTGAGFGYPTGITTDGTSLYVTDSNSIRKID